MNDAGVPARAEDYLARADALAPTLAASADAIERERRLPPPVLDALHAGGLFRMLLPRPLGGGEVDPVTFVRVIERVAQIDASTAWCLCQNAVCGMVSAFLPESAAAAIWGSDPRAVLAWGPGPGARAIAVPGGYRASGSFAFASGSRHATWLGAYCALVEPDGTPRHDAGGEPLGRTLLFPAREVALADIWDVIGLRGTAGDAYKLDGTF